VSSINARRLTKEWLESSLCHNLEDVGIKVLKLECGVAQLRGRFRIATARTVARSNCLKNKIEILCHYNYIPQRAKMDLFLL